MKLIYLQMDWCNKGNMSLQDWLEDSEKTTPVISDLQIAQMLKYKNGVKQVRETINRNKESFEIGIHLLDISQGIENNNKLKNTLLSIGYSKQSLTQAKNIYLLSQEGLNLYLQISDVKEDHSQFEECYFGILSLKTIIPMRYENMFSKMLQRSLNSIVCFDDQYSCCDNSYRIDFYSKKHNLAIEYDEGHHKFSAMEDKIREKEIQKELNCNFIRVKKRRGIRKYKQYFSLYIEF